MATLQQPSSLPNPDSSPNETMLPSNNKPLPTARKTLTSLLNAIASIPLLPASDSEPDSDMQNPRNNITRLTNNNKTHDKDQNTLRRVPPTHRHLLITLHVLFPGLVLPALDLLERGFVARVGLTGGRRRDGGRGGGSGSKVEGQRHRNAEGAGGNENRDGEEEGVKQQQRNQQQSIECEDQERKTTTAQQSPGSFYLVQSLAAAEAFSSRDRMRRRRKHSDGYGDERDEVAGTGTAAPRGYIVRLGAWHCSCAAFAFASVQGGDMSRAWGADGADEWERRGFGDGLSRAVGGGSKDAETEMEWSFGGTSLDGLAPGTGEGVPLCKHLLACLLAERWSAALGRYVIERRVGREEVAGIVADV